MMAKAKVAVPAKSNRLADHLHFIDAYPVRSLVERKENYDSRVHAQARTFSRFNWRVHTGDTFQAADKKQFLLRFEFETNTILAFAQEAPLPPDEPIPDDQEVATIAISFAIEYVSDASPDSFDENEMMDFARLYVPLHGWQFWREAMNSAAVRHRLPVPTPPVMPPAIKNAGKK